MAPALSQLRATKQVRIYVLVGMFSAYFLVELILSHLTHSMTLLIDAYHSLYNVVCIMGFLITIKMSREHTLKNTFGWARIEVLGMLISTLALAALCFSVVVEAVQTIFHASHSDPMHHPFKVLVVGIIGTVLNLVCFLFTGGFYYTNSFVSVNSGDVQVNINVRKDAQTTRGRLLAAKTSCATAEDFNVEEDTLRLHFLLDFCRDMSCSIIVVVCSTIVVMTSSFDIALYIDPALSILSVVILILAAYPFFKESGMILLQTIPEHIDVHILKKRLQAKFPSITNVHDLHVWRLNRSKVIATVHIRLISPQAYRSVASSINDFFTQEGITLSTVQPEFESEAAQFLSNGNECSLRCRKGECQSRLCCKEGMLPLDDLNNIVIGDDEHQTVTDLEVKVAKNGESQSEERESLVVQSFLETQKDIPYADGSLSNLSSENE